MAIKCPKENFKYLNAEKINLLPMETGVYCFKDKNGKILYIGKAANLKERVKNHFQAQKSIWEQTILPNFNGKIGYILTNSEIEALILEANLIKKYQPRFNVMWRDNKNYFFVGITKEDYPRLFITHQKTKLKIDIGYVGPFVDGASLKETLKILRKVFPFRTCNAIPKKPCLWYQLSRCPAPCLLKSNLGLQLPNAKEKIKRECQQNAKNIFKILTGKKTKVKNELKKEMERAAASKNFERAAKIRDKIYALEKVISHAKVLGFHESKLSENGWEETQKILQKILGTKKNISRIEAYDISNIQGKQATGSMVVFRDSKPDKSQYRKFKIKGGEEPNDTAMIKEVLKRRFNHPEWPYPDLILIDGGKAQLNAALKLKVQNLKLKTIRFIALAKKRNELFIDGRKNPILLKSLPREIFNLILQLRDEAHRFALSYHKKLRKMSLVG